MKFSLLFKLIANTIIVSMPAYYVYANDFKVSVGDSTKSPFDTDGTITLSGKGKKGEISTKSTNLNLSSRSIDDKDKDKTDPQAEKEFINTAFDKKEGTIIYQGNRNSNRNVRVKSKVVENNKVKENTTQQNRRLQEENGDISIVNVNEKVNNDNTTNNTSSSLSNNVNTQLLKSDVVMEEIAIPTDFSILKKYDEMPTSSPLGLPNLPINDKSFLSLDVVNDVIPNSLRNKDYSRLKVEIEKERVSKGKANKVMVQQNKKEIALTNFENKWIKPLKREIDVMMLSGLPMKVMLITSKDYDMYDFMVSDVGKGKEIRKIDNGIYSLLGEPFINNKKIPMCYIVFDDNFELFNNKILKPLESKIGEDATASLIVGKQVGLCLDELERNRKVYRKHTWFANEVKEIGIYPQTFRTVFPNGMRSTIYKIKENELLNNNAQLQYQQQIADAFAVLWSYNRNYKNAYKSYIEVKDYLPEYSTHYTKPILKKLETKLIRMKTNTLTLSKVWKIAREEQANSTVSKNIVNDFESLYKVQVNELKQDKNKKKSNNYIATMYDAKRPHEMKSLGETKLFEETRQKNREFEKTKNNQLSQLKVDVLKLIKGENEDKK